MTASTEQALDIIQFSFQLINAYKASVSYNSRRSFSVKVSATGAIEELNERFLEHGIGYAFVAAEQPGKLIRKDKEFLHKEVVVPALNLLHEHVFKGANDEYLRAHEHYRHGRYKECLNESLKAFESTMKTICRNRKWAYNESDTARSLIDICLKNELLPSFLQSHCAAIRTTLESGIPTTRNKLGGHGQGAERKEVAQFYAAYLLHQTAATIVFLVDAHTNTK